MRRNETSAPGASKPLDSTQPSSRRWASPPPWLISLVLHSTLAVVVVLIISRSETPSGASDQADRTAGIVLVNSSDDGKREYFDESNDESSPEADANAAATGESAAAATPSANESPVNPSDALPAAPNIGPGALESGGVGDADAATDSAAPSRKVGGEARTQVYGIEGKGSKFVYVFDRSDSMSEPDGRPLASAKLELLASLASLERVHQFQIIFFNHTAPRIFNPSGQPGRLLFADDATKQTAAKFVGGIEARGATRPEPALVMAVGMRPDVIFFLTDGDDLYLAQVERITRLNRGRASINAIQFGSGPSRGNRLLAHLTRRNGGKHMYVDTTKLNLRRR